ncbi:MAG: hypothetical protein F4Y75_03625 [Acidimicrobiia bacterium]|nr:hypothetical protein [Acidimicrobiia bacterium]
MSARRREEALNVNVARLIVPFEGVAEGEGWSALVQTETLGLLDKPDEAPDIVVEFLGRERVMIENKFDEPGAVLSLENQIQERLDRKWADGSPVRVVVGLLSPVSLRDPARAITEFSDDRFRWAVWFLDGEDRVRFPKRGCLEGGVRDFRAFLDRVSTDAMDTSELTQSVREAISEAARILAGDAKAAETYPGLLCQEIGEQTFKMAAAVMFNAVVAQSFIAANHPPIPSPTAQLREGLSQLKVLETWQEILEIDYKPIFTIADELLANIGGERLASDVLKVLFRQASEIAQNPHAQGLVGRLFGELIGDRKFLAAFYTEPSSAALLAERVVSRLEVDWADVEQIKQLRIGDFACGTGALLTATYRRIMERHRTLSRDTERQLHKHLLEDCLFGYDIMPAAVHLTAARLAGEQPSVDFNRTNTWVMGWGETPTETGTQLRLGSLDLLAEEITPALFGDGTMEVTAEGVTQTEAKAPAESFNVVIMNPPFTRSTVHEGDRLTVPQPIFAGLGNDVETQQRMKKLFAKQVSRARHKPTAYSGQVGLGSIFVDLAQEKLKPGGVLALILPVSVISGKDWGNTRALLSEHYESIEVWTLSNVEGSYSRAFSADTGMAESLIIATKKRGKRPTTRLSAQYVMLLERPQREMSAIETARVVEETKNIFLGDDRIGVTLNAGLSREVVGHPSGLVNLDLATTAAGLVADTLTFPPLTQPVDLPMTLLGAQARFGPVHRDINGINQPSGIPRGPFDVISCDESIRWEAVTYPVLWAQDSASMTSMEVLPDRHGVIRTDFEQISADRIWEGWKPQAGARRYICGATRLHIRMDLGSSDRLGACLTPKQSIGGRAWPSATVQPELTDYPDQWDKAWAVWLNTTLGLIGRWWVANRQHPGRSCLTVTTLGRIPVLDLSRITLDQVANLADFCDEILHQTLLPVYLAREDETRLQMDRVVLCEILGLSEEVLEPLETLRNAWCDEPSVHGGKKRV